MAIFPWYG
jgi:GST-like protein